MKFPALVRSLSFLYSSFLLVPLVAHAEESDDSSTAHKEKNEIADVFVVQSQGPVDGPSSEGNEKSFHWIEDGKFTGQVRNFFMATTNFGKLKDWYAWSTGGNLGYQSARFHGLGFGAKLYASVGVVGNTNEVDPSTGKGSRYEVGFFDFTERDNREIALVGEAYLDYERDGHLLWLGRHKLKSPLFNPQDGRMIPTLAQGIWYKNTALKGISAQAGFLSHVAPRSAKGWLSIEDSFGIYPRGRNRDGTPSGYSQNTSSKGLFIGHLGYKNQLIELNGWNYLTENVFNALYSEFYVRPQFAGIDWSYGIQYVGESRLNDGGNADPSLSYFQDAQSHAYGAQLRGTTQSKWTMSLNYNRITGHGRFLFPREWGRESLFVFQKRERSEGSGSLHALMGELGKTWKLKDRGKLSSKIGYGHYYRTDPQQASLNKYAFPSLYHANWDTFYHFSGPLKGLVAELLITYKGSLGNDHNNPAFIQNKVDMINWNFALNYNF